MVSYLNVHTVLEARRVKAKAEKGYGPKVLIVGGVDVGKSSLSRILLSYSARVGSVPTYVDLDVGQNGITVPGMLAAVHVNRPFDIEHGVSKLSPLSFFFGHVTPGKNVPLYKKQMDLMSAELSRHFASKPEARAGGMIINTCGWTDGEGYDLILHAIRTFRVDVVLVLDHERLYADIKSTQFDHPVECLKLRKSGGVVPRDPDVRRADRQQAIRDYFHGVQNELSPHVVVVNFSVVKTCRVGGGPQAPSTALPIGAERAVDVTAVAEIEPSIELTHCLCALSYGSDVESSLSTNVCGYVLVTNVEEEYKRLHLLAPCPGKLPSVILLTTDVQSIDGRSI